VTAIKRAEDDDDLVIRFYEAAGSALNARVRTQWQVLAAGAVNFMEDNMADGPAMDAGGDSFDLVLRPWEIRTVKLRLKPVDGVVMSGTRGPGAVRQF
jgi:alpha-mannosidase